MKNHMQELMLCLSFVLSFGHFASAEQDTIIVTIENVDFTESHDYMDVCITTQNFVDVVSVSYTVKWNPQFFQLDEVGNLNPILEFDFNMGKKEEGLLPVLWFDRLLESKSLPENDTLMCLNFTMIDEPCDGDRITLVNDPTDIAFTNEDEGIPFQIIPGEVTNPRCQTTTSNSDFDDGSAFEIYPNPSFGDVTIQSEYAIEKTELFDMAGKKIADYVGKNFHVSEKGWFLLKVHTREGTGHKRVLIN